MRFTKNTFGALLAGLLISLLIAACGSTDSDAMRVLQNNATGTISALNGQLRTAEATVTAMGTVMVRLEGAQTALAIERTKSADLLTRLNDGNSPIVPLNPTPADSRTTPSGGNNVTPGAPDVQNASTQPGNLLTIDRVATAKGVDNVGCAVGETTNFAVTDARIWVIAYVRNVKPGITFTSHWSGGSLNKDFSWTTKASSAKICINFYIEPATLGVAAGDYSVTLSAQDAAGAAPLSFKVQ